MSKDNERSSSGDYAASRASRTMQNLPQTTAQRHPADPPTRALAEWADSLLPPGRLEIESSSEGVQQSLPGNTSLVAATG